MYRILYDDIDEWERMHVERSIAGRLLHQHLKYRANKPWSTFAEKHDLEHCPDLTLARVVDEILPPTQCGDRRRVIVINFDEVSDVLVSNREHLTKVLKLLVDSKSLCYFCVLLTSTQALQVLQLPTSSGIGHKSISLPLLKIDHMYKVVEHITSLCAPHVKEADLGCVAQLIRTTPHDELPTARELRHFTYLLELLAGVPRFLEKALFCMGCKSSSRVFRPEIFLRNVERVHDSTFVLDELLRAVVDAITTKYDRFLGHLQSLEVFPLLVTCSLFGARFYRSQRIEYGPVEGGDVRLPADVHYIEELEDSGVIFLTKPQQTSSARQQPHCLPSAPRRHDDWSQRSSLLRPWLSTKAASDNQNFSIVIPFIWMHLVVARATLDATPQSPPLPQIQLLCQLGSALTPSEKERLSLSVLALRMYFLAECDRVGHGEVMRFEVGDLFPIPQGREIDPSHVDLPAGCSWKVAQSTQQIVATTFKSLPPSAKQHRQHGDVLFGRSHSQPQPRSQSEAMQVFWQNKEKTQSADSFVLSMPGIGLQEKQSHAFKHAIQAGRSGQKGNTVSANCIKKEHDKFRPSCPHLFVFITDKRVVPAAHAQLDKCELVIDASNEEDFYGPFLARLKLRHDKDENVPLADPTEALKSWLAASSSVSPTAAAAAAVASAASSSSVDAESSRPRKKQRTAPLSSSSNHHWQGPRQRRRKRRQ